MGVYRWYARRPSNRRYLTVVFLFIFGLMAKPQIITLPFVFLLWDYWPLRRIFPGAASLGECASRVTIPARTFKALVKEKIPLFIICLADSLITLKAQHAGRPSSWPYSIWIRIGNAIVAYVRYIGKAIWPSKLAIMYLHPGHNLKFWQVALSALALLTITALVVLYHRYRYLPVGWFWFLGTMVPTIGIMQVGRQAMADRYGYQAYLGLFLMACWGISDWAAKRHLPKGALPCVSLAVLLALGAVTHRQIGYWSDNMMLWCHALDATGNNWMAHDMVGGLLYKSGHYEESLVHYRAVLQNESHRRRCKPSAGFGRPETRQSC